MSENKKRKHNPVINILKFLFSVMVMLFHSRRVFPGGYIAVDFFFLVSGVLMATSMERRSGRNETAGKATALFMLRKAGNIFPYYLVAWFISFFTKAYFKQWSFREAVKVLFLSPYNILMVEMGGFYDLGHFMNASWYISAMLLAMLILFPFRKNHKDLLDFVIAPVLFIFLIGYSYQTRGHMSLVGGWDKQLHMYNGFIRGVCEIAFGCFLYRASNYLAKRRIAGKMTLTLLEVFCYSLVFLMAWRTGHSILDYTLVFIICIGIVLTFSKTTFSGDLKGTKLSSFLGQFSLYVYLSEGFIVDYASKIQRRIALRFPVLDNYFLVYFTLVITLSLIIMFMGKYLKRVFDRIAATSTVVQN